MGNPAASPALTRKEPLWKRVGHVLIVSLRAIQCVLAFLLAMVLGAFMGRLIPSSAFADSEVKGVLGFASLLSTLKEALTLMPKLKAYIVTGSSPNLWDASSFVFVSSLALAAALTAAIFEPPKVVPGELKSPTSITPVVFIGSGQGSSFMVPFSNEAGGCDKSLREFANGLVWLPGSENFIDQLANGLSHCSVPGRPVHVEIRGFASSSVFHSSKEGPECGNSDELNVEIANQRAQKVYTEMQRHSEQAREPIVFRIRRWNDIGEMESERGFDDHIEGRFDKFSGDFTRRADIVITSAGACTPRNKR